jgi:hypothetical protein
VKLRLSLTLTFERARPDTEGAPEVDTTGAAILERAEPAPIGFVVPEYRSDPFEERRT